ncbi:MAG: hypothetical protein WC223_12580 [Bacteroidales bacterium]
MSEYKHNEKELSFVDYIEQDIFNRVKHNKKSVEKLALKFGIANKNLTKELTELAIVRIARSIAQNKELTSKEKYFQIVDLYNNQVNLSHRTSESILLQQYSTPAPIGYLAGLYVLGSEGLSGHGYKMFRKAAMSDAEFKRKWGVKPGKTYHPQKQQDYSANKQYFEPSAGNGLLTIVFEPQDVVVNELDDIRNANLQTQGFAEVHRFDATKNIAIEKNFYRIFDGIITNPPFGSLDKEVIFGEKTDRFPIKTLDHVMCLRALDCMNERGRAAMIIGGHTKWDELGRIQAGKNRIFFNYLYRYYYVDDVINIDGHRLYSRQGTAFDVRLILINGRKYLSEGVAPLKQSHDTTVYSFEELWERVMLSMPKNESNQEIKERLYKKMDLMLNLKLQKARLDLLSMGNVLGEIKDWKGDANSVFKTLAASNHSKGKREKHDFYATEPKAAELLLKLEKFSTDIWECACGEGHLSKVFEKAGYKVKSTDLVERGFGKGGVNFLSENIKEWNGDIITNPPYKYATEFIEKALQIIPENKKVAMFLKLLFLEGKERKEFFKKYPPKTIYVSSSRLLCSKNAAFKEERDIRVVAYGWFVWEKGYKGTTTIKWFN